MGQKLSKKRGYSALKADKLADSEIKFVFKETDHFLSSGKLRSHKSMPDISYRVKKNVNVDVKKAVSYHDVYTRRRLEEDEDDEEEVEYENVYVNIENINEDKKLNVEGKIKHENDKVDYEEKKVIFDGKKVHVVEERKINDDVVKPCNLHPRIYGERPNLIGNYKNVIEQLKQTSNSVSTEKTEASYEAFEENKKSSGTTKAETSNHLQLPEVIRRPSSDQLQEVIHNVRLAKRRIKYYDGKDNVSDIQSSLDRSLEAIEKIQSTNPTINALKTAIGLKINQYKQVITEKESKLSQKKEQETPNQSSSSETPNKQHFQSLVEFFSQLTKKLDSIKENIIDYYGTSKDDEYINIVKELDDHITALKGIDCRGDVRIVLTEEQYEDYITRLKKQFEVIAEDNERNLLTKKRKLSVVEQNINRRKRSQVIESNCYVGQLPEGFDTANIKEWIATNERIKEEAASNQNFEDQRNTLTSNQDQEEFSSHQDSENLNDHSYRRHTIGDQDQEELDSGRSAKNSVTLLSSTNSSVLEIIEPNRRKFSTSQSFDQEELPSYIELRQKSINEEIFRLQRQYTINDEIYFKEQEETTAVSKPKTGFNMFLDDESDETEEDPPTSRLDQLSRSTSVNTEEEFYDCDEFEEVENDEFYEAQEGLLLEDKDDNCNKKILPPKSEREENRSSGHWEEQDEFNNFEDSEDDPNKVGEEREAEQSEDLRKLRWSVEDVEKSEDFRRLKYRKQEMKVNWKEQETDKSKEQRLLENWEEQVTDSEDEEQIEYHDEDLKITKNLNFVIAESSNDELEAGFLDFDDLHFQQTSDDDAYFEYNYSSDDSNEEGPAKNHQVQPQSSRIVETRNFSNPTMNEEEISTNNLFDDEENLIIRHGLNPINDEAETSSKNIFSDKENSALQQDSNSTIDDEEQSSKNFFINEESLTTPHNSNPVKNEEISSSNNLEMRRDSKKFEDFDKFVQSPTYETEIIEPMKNSEDLHSGKKEEIQTKIEECEKINAKTEIDGTIMITTGNDKIFTDNSEIEQVKTDKQSHLEDQTEILRRNEDIFKDNSKIQADANEQLKIEDQTEIIPRRNEHIFIDNTKIQKPETSDEPKLEDQPAIKEEQIFEDNSKIEQAKINQHQPEILTTRKEDIFKIEETETNQQPKIEDQRIARKQENFDNNHPLSREEKLLGDDLNEDCDNYDTFEDEKKKVEEDMNCLHGEDNQTRKLRRKRYASGHYEYNELPTVEEETDVLDEIEDSLKDSSESKNIIRNKVKDTVTAKLIEFEDEDESTKYVISEEEEKKTNYVTDIDEIFGMEATPSYLSSKQDPPVYKFEDDSKLEIDIRISEASNSTEDDHFLENPSHEPSPINKAKIFKLESKASTTKEENLQSEDRRNPRFIKDNLRVETHHSTPEDDSSTSIKTPTDEHFLEDSSSSSNLKGVDKETRLKLDTVFDCLEDMKLCVEEFEGSKTDEDYMNIYENLFKSMKILNGIKSSNGDIIAQKQFILQSINVCMGTLEDKAE